jgi:hypothetical protein
VGSGSAGAGVATGVSYLDDAALWCGLGRRLSKEEKGDAYLSCLLASLYTSMSSLGLATVRVRMNTCSFVHA